ncbi:putative polygalacturonase [Vitis vinifera]|uniref:Putative polygalacturonase n=1 Tax=Vitis vinifera TaxID=29760 RepID=A0A438IZ17_VITVI|nr:putative polygalacturonase [Vitis vinifera]
MEFCLNLRKPHALGIVSAVLILGLLSFRVAECQTSSFMKPIKYKALRCRKHSAVLTDFGATGDGKTINTKAFKSAIDHLSQFADDGGAELIVPPGKWLTGSFNLTSHFTLYIDKDAVILGAQDESAYPLIEVLPSYGVGRDGGGRHSSLIFGTNLTDVVITGGNGTLNGQGKYWWDKFRAKKNVLVKDLTILAPIDSPNTDGINPGITGFFCVNFGYIHAKKVRIEDCFIVSGDDCIAVKSGWDQYGYKFGMPTKDLLIRRLTCISPDSATIALGSEMSGGIKNVWAET